MALIKCPECGKEISDKAVACVNCGYPIREFLSDNQEAVSDEVNESARKPDKTERACSGT